MIARLLPLPAIILLCFYCSAPRHVIHSGKVTPKGHVKLGCNGSYSLPTATIKALFSGIEGGTRRITGQDTIVYDSSFNSFTKAMTIYSVDPLLLNVDFYIRYGLMERVDIGYAWNGGVHVFDARFQFLGSTGTVRNPSKEKWYGSAGIQYSGQSYELPSFLGDLQSALKYRLKRKDLLIPIAFSRSFGEEEKYGSVGFGALYSITWLTYDYAPNIVYELVALAYRPVAEVPRGTTHFSAYGAFANLKLGYRFIYGLLGLSLYYQDYGTFNLFKNETVSFNGMSIIPSLGIQFAF
jgi:hypothetical protein